MVRNIEQQQTHGNRLSQPSGRATSVHTAVSAVDQDPGFGSETAPIALPSRPREPTWLPMAAAKMKVRGSAKYGEFQIKMAARMHNGHS